MDFLPWWAYAVIAVGLFVPLGVTEWIDNKLMPPGRSLYPIGLVLVLGIVAGFGLAVFAAIDAYLIR